MANEGASSKISRNLGSAPVAIVGAHHQGPEFLSDLFVRHPTHTRHLSLCHAGVLEPRSNLPRGGGSQWGAMP